MVKKVLFQLLIVTSISSYSQTWSPPGATWHYSYIGVFYTTGYIKLSYIGDTIIANQPAKKFEKFNHTYNYWNNQYYIGVFGYEYMYEDSGIVYVWFNNNWDTLYNFNATIGDKWSYAKQPNFPSCDTNSFLTVLDTGTTLVNNQSLRFLVVQFHLDSIFPFQPEDTLIERIGFKNSYMFPYDYCDGAFDANEGGGLRCYSDNNFPLYQNPLFPYNCDFIVDVDEIELDSRYSIFPNPTNSSIMVEGLLNNNSFNYSILSIEGKLLKKGTSSGEINVEELNDGIYFMRLNNSYNNYYKFIKFK